MAKKLYSTSIALPAPFVANSCDPVDARLIVESFTDITTNAGDTFGVISGIYCKVYEGMDVYVSSEKATYKYVGGSDANGILLTEVQKTQNWRKVSDPSNSVDALEKTIEELNTRIDETTPKNEDGSITVGGPESDGTSVSVNIDGSDKVLTISAEGVLVNLGLKWNKVNGLQLVGKDDTVITTIPATDFIKDGMLETVTIEENPSGHTEGTYIHFVFNTDAGKSDIYLNMNELTPFATEEWVLEKLSHYATSADVHSTITALNTKVNNFSAATNTRFSNLTTTVNNFSAATHTRLNTTDGNVTNLTNRVTSFSGATDARFDGLDATIEANELATAASLNDLNTRIIAVSGHSKNLETTVINFSAATHNRLNALDGDITSLESKVDSFSAATNSRINSVNSDLQNYKSTVSTTYATSANVHNTINAINSSLTTKINNVDSRVTQLSGATHNRFASTDSTISSLSSTVTNFSAATNTRFSNLTTTVNNFSAATHNRINSLNTTVVNFSAATNSRFSTVTSNISNLTTTVNNFSAATHNRFTTVTNSVNDVNSRVTTLSAATNTRFGSYATSANTHNAIQAVNNKFASYATSANVHNTISALKTEISNLTSRVTALENAGVNEATIQSIIRNYIKGTANEIKVTTASTSVTIGFDDNAIFGETEDYK